MARWNSATDLPPRLPLSALDDIDWSALEHAYGQADNVPSLIRELAADDEAQHQAALTELFGTIVHQGTVYTASPFAVPFIVDLALEQTEIRADLLGLLQFMAYGYEESVFPDGYPLAAASEEQARVDSQPNPYGVDVVNTHLAVSRAADEITSLLDDDDPTVRSEAAHLLAYLPSAGSASFATISERLAAATDEATEVSMLLALGVLGRQLGIEPPIAARPSSRPATTLASTCARSLAGDRSMIEPLVAALSDDLPPLGSWLDGSTATIICRSISVHENWLTPDLFEPLGAQLRKLPPFEKPWIAGLLLQTVFANRWPPPESSSDLDSLHREALRLLASSDGWSVAGAKNSNWSLQLAEFLLPSTEPNLTRYLDGHELSACLDDARRQQLTAARRRAVEQ